MRLYFEFENELKFYNPGPLLLIDTSEAQDISEDYLQKADLVGETLA